MKKPSPKFSKSKAARRTIPSLFTSPASKWRKRCVTDWPALADKLARSFWPGPLTLVLATRKKIPDIVTAGGATVGVRWPSHPFIQAVIRECGFPLAAPSANLSEPGFPDECRSTCAQQLGDKISLIVDGGQSQVGIESTVLDLTVSPPQILRPGMIHAESLAAVMGEVQQSKGQKSEVAAASVAQSGVVGKTLCAQGKIAGVELARRRGFEVATFNTSTRHSQPATSSPTRTFRRRKISRR